MASSTSWSAPALLTEDVQFRSLGAVVVDEQHRFGVEQRAGLRAKGRIEDPGAGTIDPDLLVMTATPIPRTAAMVVFGDLDMTLLDELPPGRAPVTTFWARGDLEEASAWARVREEVAAGHRAYVICPLVEESEGVVARSAVEEHARLSGTVLAGLEVGLLHGQMPTAQKKEVMDRFRDGQVQVLVATTVIEVGIDVPEATVAVIQDADRFGLAQLHQLRGRVGRSSPASWCYLFGRGHVGGRRRPSRRPSSGPPTASSWPRSTSSCGARAPFSASARPARADCAWPSWPATRSGCSGPGRRPKRSWTATPELARHPELADEVRFTLDDEEAAFLFKS